MRTWENQHRLPNHDRWQDAVRRVWRAHAVNPLNADYRAELALLYSWEALRPQWSQARRDLFRDRAAGFYREAIARRPTWALAWVNLAENQLLTRGLDDRALFAMDKAIELGPWDPVVQQKTIWMGAALWDALTPAWRQRILGTAERALSANNDVDQIVRVAAQYGWEDHLRPLLKQERHIRLYSRLLDPKIAR